jgi:hypothetical protein
VRAWAGTAEDYDTALYTREALRRAGVDARVVPLEATLSYPISRSLRLLTPSVYVGPGRANRRPQAALTRVHGRFDAALTEDVLPEDPTSADPRHIPTYNAYDPLPAPSLSSPVR